MQSNKINLATLFSLIDTNNDKSLSLGEFKQKMRALDTPIDEAELQELFQHLDK